MLHTPVAQASSSRSSSSSSIPAPPTAEQKQESIKALEKKLAEMTPEMTVESAIEMIRNYLDLKGIEGTPMKKLFYLQSQESLSAVLATIIDERDVRMSSDQEKEWKAMLTQKGATPSAGAEAAKRVEIIDSKSNAVATILTIIKNIRTKYPNDASDRTVVHPKNYDNVQGGKEAARNIKTQILTLDQALQKLGVVAQRAALSAMAARVAPSVAVAPSGGFAQGFAQGSPGPVSDESDESDYV